MALITALSSGEESLVPPLLYEAVRVAPSQTIEVLVGCVDALLAGLAEELDIPKAEAVRRLGLTLASEPPAGGADGNGQTPPPVD